MKAPFSEYLKSLKPGLQQMVSILNETYEYVSVLAADSVGFRISISQRAKEVSNQTMTAERGIVVRVMKHGLYSEAALNSFDPARAEEAAAQVKADIERQIAMLKASGTEVYHTGRLTDEPAELFAEMETEQLPETADLQALIRALTALSQESMKKSPDLIDFRIVAQSTHVCKLFLTAHRDLAESYVYSEGAVAPIGVRGQRNEMSYQGISGRVGPELFRQLKDYTEESIRTVEELLSADRIVPGEYDIITSPEVSGLIAHEAFGHGVEMDMFVKNRALGKEYIGRRVGSDHVTMHEGARCALNVTSYAFDDEGVLAGDVTEIDHGILKTGVCDALSALRLGIQPTGNGKRENYAHKVYTRMTNTIFDSGSDRLEDMIASIQHGYLLKGMQSGMEDPKHWGIQCIIERGYEIKDGRLTGRVVTPIVMTGYVPDLLGSVSMVSGDREVFGNGACGKGHKEWVKVADGGPYLKAKARLG